MTFAPGVKGNPGQGLFRTVPESESAGRSRSCFCEF